MIENDLMRTCPSKIMPPRVGMLLVLSQLDT